VKQDFVKSGWALESQIITPLSLQLEKRAQINVPYVTTEWD
jgi:hypothetical protein